MHRAESIMVAVETVVDGLLTTEDRVQRGRVYPVADDGVPALTVEKGPDDVIEGSQNIAFIDRLLTVKIIAHIKTTGTYETDLNQIANEVYVAVMAVDDLGLSFVQSVTPLGDDEPEAVAANKDTGRMEMKFSIHYRHALKDPGS